MYCEDVLSSVGWLVRHARGLPSGVILVEVPNVASVGVDVVVVSLVFFFQAEDGIRDTSVTGVQTCALPISEMLENTGLPIPRQKPDLRDQVGAVPKEGLVFCRRHDPAGDAVEVSFAFAGQRRSEERRVGKECRAEGGHGDGKKSWCDVVVEE